MRVGKIFLGRASYKVPPSLSREVGRVIVHWAYFEHYLQDIVWLLLDLDDKRGRIAVKEPRAVDRIDMIADLATLRSLKLPALKTFRKKTEEVAGWRNLLAHGRWVRNQIGDWRVQQTRGSYPDDIQGPHSRKRGLDPEGITPTVEGLRSIVESIEGLIAGARGLKENFEKELESSRRDAVTVEAAP